MCTAMESNLGLRGEKRTNKALRHYVALYYVIFILYFIILYTVAW